MLYYVAWFSWVNRRPTSNQKNFPTHPWRHRHNTIKLMVITIPPLVHTYGMSRRPIAPKFGMYNRPKTKGFIKIYLNINAWIRKYIYGLTLFTVHNLTRKNTCVMQWWIMCVCVCGGYPCIPRTRAHRSQQTSSISRCVSSKTSEHMTFSNS